MQTLRKIDLYTRLRIARRAAQAASNIIMAYYGQIQTIRTKSSDLDLVTTVDLEADEIIREILQEETPEDTIITEESFQNGQIIDLTSAWIVDPLDGTTNYAHGFPHFAVSIAYVENGEPKVAAILDPFKNEIFTAIDKGDVLRNGVPIKVSAIDDLGKALLATGFPYNIQVGTDEETNIGLHDRFLKLTHGIRRAGAAALDLAYVACGRLDGFWELHLAPWDLAAGILLIQRAGGMVSGLHGEPLNLSQRYINIIGSNSKLHESLVRVVSENSKS